MRLESPTLRTVSLAGPAPTLLPQLRVGAVLQAVATVDSAGRLFLDIGNTRYAARLASSDTGVPRDGERLQLKVLRESPVLAFEAVRLKSGATSSNATADALRRFLPRQDSAAPLAANLALLAQTDAGDGLPPAVLQAATRLWLAMPDTDAAANPQQLRQALTDSGAFLEAKLAGAPTPTGNARLGNDLKALLLQFNRVLQEAGARASAAAPNAAPAPVPTLSGALQPLPSSAASLAALAGPEQHLHELARQTEGALARLTTLQVANSAPDTQPQALLFELPIRHDDAVSMLRLRIERDDSRQAAEQAQHTAWSVEAALDLGSNGALHARVTLQEQRIDVQLRASSPHIVAALSAQREQLAALLRESGLEVDRVVCLHGLPPAQTDSRTPHLLDLHA